MSYHLETVASRHTKIYRQLYHYYDFCEQTRRLSPITIKSKVYIINSFVRHAQLKDLRKITNRQIYAWINFQIEHGNSGRSVNDRLAHLKAMLRWQKEMNLEMPHLQLGLIPKLREVPPRKVCFTRAEVRRALDESDLETWLLIHLAFDCGLRISELDNLRIQDIHGRKLTIVGKGQKRRYAYLSPEVQKRLHSWIQEQKIQSYLWPSPLCAGRPLAICTLRQKMRDAFRRAGLSDFCPHDLRHSYATDLKQLGVSTRLIQAGLGHATEAVTEKYLSDLDGLDLSEIYRHKYAQK